MTSSALCVVCFEPAAAGISCAGEPKHFTCSDCLEQLVLHKAQQLKETDEIGKRADGSSPEVAKALAGFIFCPCHGVGGCIAKQPFPERDLASVLSDEAFSTYVEGRTLLKCAEAESKAYQDANETLQSELNGMRAATGAVIAHGSKLLAKQMKREMPDARQCAVCSYGPMDHRDCADLAAHHGQVLEGGYKIDNSCPRCGWFSEDKADWPLWDGTIQESEEGGALLDPKAAEELVRSEREREVAEAKERQEAAERKAAQAVHFRQLAEARVRNQRSSLMAMVDEATQHRKEERALRKKLEAEAASERARREAIESAIGLGASRLRRLPYQHCCQDDQPRLKPVSKSLHPASNSTRTRPCSAPLAPPPPPRAVQPTGAEIDLRGPEVFMEVLGSTPCSGRRVTSAPVLRSQRRPLLSPLSPPMKGSGSLRATLNAARKDAELEW